LREFLTLFISSKAEYIKETCRGTTVPHVSPDAIANMDLKIPPLPEQKRIVDLISSVDSYIEALQQQLETAKRSRNAVLHELLTAGGDDWVEHKLIDVFEIYQPQTIAKSLMSNDGEFIVFGANGPIGRYHEFNHEEPEVVVTCRGATCGTINMTPPKTWITGNAMVVSPKTSGVSKDFLYWALVAGVDIQSVISGSAQPQITREGLAPVKIKIPPLSRQEEIVHLISGFELTISHLEGSLNKTKTLRSGLLSDLLSGEHEIPASYDKVIGAA
jgi:restriction endonuclease S subunit